MSEYATTHDVNPNPNLDPNLNVGGRGRERDFTIDPQTGARIARELPPEAGPLIQICDLHGGYVLALLSQAQDPQGHNMALRCKVRTILSQDRTGLGAQISTCLVAEFGLTPEEADAMIPPELVSPEMAAARKQREEDREAERLRQEREAAGERPYDWGRHPSEQRDAAGWQQHDEQAQQRFEQERREQQQPEHERARDEVTGRYVAQEHHEPEHVHLTMDNATVEGDVRHEGEQQPQREA